ncbi:MAG: MarR family winged helix-turn-helix transcriptional regulator [Alphaproteobacteria bacterium]
MPPLSVTRRSLLVGGSDAAFRALISNLIAMAGQLAALRSHLAARLGVTGPQFGLVLAVAQLEGAHGVNVGAVARHQGVTGAFVTAEAGKLARRGFIVKRGSPADGRGVLLSLSAKGWRALTAAGPEIQAVNDAMFGSLSVREFRSLDRIVRRLTAGGERALAKRRARRH